MPISLYNFSGSVSLVQNDGPHHDRVLMNSSVHCWKNEGPPSCVGAPRPHFVGRGKRRGPRKTPWGAGGLDSHRQNSFFVGLGFVRFVGESRSSSRRYPTPLCCGDGVAGRWHALGTSSIENNWARMLAKNVICAEYR